MRSELRERDFESFFRVPFVCYGDATPYVSPMKSDLRRYLDGARNPLFRSNGDFTFFTMHQEGKPVGRIVAHVHHESNRIHGLRRSYFGFFDCIDDIEVESGEGGAATRSWPATSISQPCSRSVC